MTLLSTAERRLATAKDLLGELLSIVEAGENDGVSIVDFDGPLDPRWKHALARARMFLGRTAPQRREPTPTGAT